MINRIALSPVVNGTDKLQFYRIPKEESVRPNRDAALIVAWMRTHLPWVTMFAMYKLLRNYYEHEDTDTEHDFNEAEQIARQAGHEF